MKRILLFSCIFLLVSCKKEIIYIYTQYPPTTQTISTLTNRDLLLNLDATLSSSNSGHNVWYDLSGNNHHATLMNGARFEGNKVVFDGQNDIAHLGKIGGYDNKITIECWVRTTDIEMRSRSILTTNKTGDFVFYSSGDNRRRVTNFGTYNDSPFRSYCYGTIDIAKNGWTHYVVTYDNSSETVIIYIDGKFNASYNRSGKLIASELSIGNIMTRLDEGWKGDISILRVYAKVLSHYQISESYINDKSKFGK